MRFPLGLESRWQRDEVRGWATFWVLRIQRPQSGHPMRNRCAVQTANRGVWLELSHLSSSHQGQDQLRLQCRRRVGTVLQLHRGRNNMSSLSIVVLFPVQRLPPHVSIMLTPGRGESCGCPWKWVVKGSAYCFCRSCCVHADLNEAPPKREQGESIPVQEKPRDCKISSSNLDQSMKLFKVVRY